MTLVKFYLCLSVPGREEFWFCSLCVSSEQKSVCCKVLCKFCHLSIWLRLEFGFAFFPVKNKRNEMFMKIGTELNLN